MSKRTTQYPGLDPDQLDPNIFRQDFEGDPDRIAGALRGELLAYLRRTSGKKRGLTTGSLSRIVSLPRRRERKSSKGRVEETVEQKVIRQAAENMHQAYATRDDIAAKIKLREDRWNAKDPETEFIVRSLHEASRRLPDANNYLAAIAGYQGNFMRHFGPLFEDIARASHSENDRDAVAPYIYVGNDGEVWADEGGHRRVSVSAWALADGYERFYTGEGRGDTFTEPTVTMRDVNISPQYYQAPRKRHLSIVDAHTRDPFKGEKALEVLEAFDKFDALVAQVHRGIEFGHGGKTSADQLVDLLYNEIKAGSHDYCARFAAKLVMMPPAKTRADIEALVGELGIEIAKRALYYRIRIDQRENLHLKKGKAMIGPENAEICAALTDRGFRYQFQRDVQIARGILQHLVLDDEIVEQDDFSSRDVGLRKVDHHEKGRLFGVQETTANIALLSDVGSQMASSRLRLANLVRRNEDGKD